MTPHRGSGLARRLLGEQALGRQLRAHALTTAADTFFAVSLAGSLFFNVSLDASRPRIVMYLVFTIAPLAVIAPFIGPAIDGYRGGHRMVLAAVCAGRAVLCVLLVGHLRSLFLFPEAFGCLALGKAYSVAKTALVPRLANDPSRLVEANSRLSRVAAVSGAIAAVLAAGLITKSSAGPVLVVAATLYGGAALTALTLPRPGASVSTVSRALEYEELHAPAPLLAAAAMAVLRAATGFLAFLLAFALKSAGEPAWVFGAALAASGAGSFAGTYLAPRMRRLLREEQMLALALVVPAVFVLAAGVQVGRPSVFGAAFALGTSASVGRQAFDSLIQHRAPDVNRARSFARFETLFQLSWAVGALVPVVFRAPTWVGLLSLAGVLIVSSAAYITGARSVLRFEPEALATRERVHRLLTAPEPPPEAMVLLDAEELAARGAHRLAILQAALAYDVLVERILAPLAGEHEPVADHLNDGRNPGRLWVGGPLLDCLAPPLQQALAISPRADAGLRQQWLDLERLRRAAVCSTEQFGAGDSDHAIAMAGQLSAALQEAASAAALNHAPGGARAPR